MGITEKEPFYDCPRYAKCNVNNCPLHPKYPELISDQEDEEQKCSLAKTGRVRELLINSEKASASPIFEKNVERLSCIRFSITHGHDPKTIRIRIAANFLHILKYNGMSPREYSAKIRWENMSPEEQREIKERGAKQLKKLSDIQGTSEHKGENTYLSDQPQNEKILIPAH